MSDDSSGPLSSADSGDLEDCSSECANTGRKEGELGKMVVLYEFANGKIFVVGPHWGFALGMGVFMAVAAISYHAAIMSTYTNVYLKLMIYTLMTTTGTTFLITVLTDPGIVRPKKRRPRVLLNDRVTGTGKWNYSRAPEDVPMDVQLGHAVVAQPATAGRRQLVYPIDAPHAADSNHDAVLRRNKNNSDAESVPVTIHPDTDIRVGVSGTHQMYRGAADLLSSPEHPYSGCADLTLPSELHTVSRRRQQQAKRQGSTHAVHDTNDAILLQPTTQTKLHPTAHTNHDATTTTGGSSSSSRTAAHSLATTTATGILFTDTSSASRLLTTGTYSLDTSTTATGSIGVHVNPRWETRARTRSSGSSGSSALGGSSEGTRSHSSDYSNREGDSSRVNVGATSRSLYYDDGEDKRRGDRLYCPICEVTVIGTTVHCEECDVCIEGHDHHCPWTSKCIGDKNVYAFYAWIIAAGITMVSMVLSAAFTGKSAVLQVLLLSGPKVFSYVLQKTVMYFFNVDLLKLLHLAT